MGKIRNGLIKAGAVVTLASSLVSTGKLIKSSYDMGKMEVEANALANKRQAYIEQISTMNEYKAYLNRKLDESFSAYRAGDISKEQFDKKTDQYLEKDDKEGLIRETNVGEFLLENNSSSVFFNMGIEEGRSRDEISKKKYEIGAFSVLSGASATAFGASLMANRANSKKEEDLESNEELEFEQ